MENNTQKTATAPIIFVTGIGQTWSALKTDPDHRWNLFPGDKQVLFYDYPKGGKQRLARFAFKALRTALSGKTAVKTSDIDGVFKDVFRWCTVDENGELPEQVDVRIYGARSFDVLRNVDFATGGYTDDFGKSLLRRVYTDIPCRNLP